MSALAAQALRVATFLALFSVAQGKEPPKPPITFVLTVAAASLTETPIPLVPANDVLLRQPATPRSAVRTTVAVEARDKSGATWDMVPKGALMIEARLVDKRAYCGLALRKESSVYLNHMALCAVDFDDDGAFDSFFLDRNFSGRMRSAFEVEQLEPLSGISLTYRRLDTSELPRSDLILRASIRRESAFVFLRWQTVTLSVVMEVPPELVPSVSNYSARQLLLQLAGPVGDRTPYEILISGPPTGTRGLGPYVIQRSDLSGTQAATVTSAAPAGDLYLRLTGFVFAGVPVHTSVLEQEPSQ